MSISALSQGDPEAALLECRSSTCIDKPLRVVLSPLTTFVRWSLFRPVQLTGSCEKVTACFARAVVNLYHYVIGVPFRMGAFDAQRLERSEQAFQACVTESNTDRGVKWQYCSSDQFKVKDETLLEQLKFARIDGSFNIPEKIDEANRTCVIYFPSLGSTPAMHKKKIALFLAEGFDVFTFDWPGGYCMREHVDHAQVAINVCRDRFGQGKKLAAFASCRSTVPLFHTACKNSDLHVVAITPPPSIASVIDLQNCCAKAFGRLGLKMMQTDPSEMPDAFDSVDALKKVDWSSGDAKICIVTVQGDRTIPENTVDRFQKATSPNIVQHIRCVPDETNGSDPHFGNVLKNSGIWEQICNFLVS